MVWKLENPLEFPQNPVELRQNPVEFPQNPVELKTYSKEKSTLESSDLSQLLLSWTKYVNERVLSRKRELKTHLNFFSSSSYYSASSASPSPTQRMNPFCTIPNSVTDRTQGVTLKRERSEIQWKKWKTVKELKTSERQWKPVKESERQWKKGNRRW